MGEAVGAVWEPPPPPPAALPATRLELAALERLCGWALVVALGVFVVEEVAELEAVEAAAAAAGVAAVPPRAVSMPAHWGWMVVRPRLRSLKVAVDPTYRHTYRYGCCCYCCWCCCSC